MSSLNSPSFSSRVALASLPTASAGLATLPWVWDSQFLDDVAVSSPGNLLFTLWAAC